MRYMNIFKTRANKKKITVIFVFGTPKYYRLGPFQVSNDFTVDQCNDMTTQQNNK